MILQTFTKQTLKINTFYEYVGRAHPDVCGLQNICTFFLFNQSYLILKNIHIENWQGP